jgi:lipooligosaccharide transport system ATP-binding protein
VAEGSPLQLIREHSTCEVFELRFALDEQSKHVAELSTLADRVEELPDRLLLYTDDGEAALSEAHRRGVRPLSSLVRRSSLEDVFLRLTGRSLVE